MFLIVVSLAAISPYISVSLASSAVLVAYMVWDCARAARGGRAGAPRHRAPRRRQR